jgi:uncharacterized protein (TIRG00374 family)
LRTGLIAVAGIGVAAAAVITALTGGRATIDGLARLPLATVALVLALNVVSWLGEAVVFASLAGIRGIRAVPRMVAVYVGGGFPALVTPFGSGGIPGWVYALTREGLSTGQAAAVVGARGLLTSVFFVLAGGVAVVVVPARMGGSTGASLAGFAVLLAVLALVTAIVARPGRVVAVLRALLLSRPAQRALGAGRAGRLADAAERETDDFAEGLRRLVRDRPLAVAAAFAGLAVSRACLLCILPVIMSGLGWRGEVLPVLATVVGVWALASGSPTPGGSGAVDAAMAAALSAFTLPATAGAAALVWRGVTFYFDLFVGWVLFSGYLAGRRGARYPMRGDGAGSGVR